jgi:hypothetical protein
MRSTTPWCVMLVAFIGLASAGLHGQAAASRASWMVTNDKVVAASSGDPASVAALVDDVIKGSLLLDTIAASSPDLKANLVSAELAYRNKHHGGVPDAQVNGGSQRTGQGNRRATVRLH